MDSWTQLIDGKPIELYVGQLWKKPEDSIVPFDTPEVFDTRGEIILLHHSPLGIFITAKFYLKQTPEKFVVKTNEISDFLWDAIPADEITVKNIKEMN